MALTHDKAKKQWLVEWRGLKFCIVKDSSITRHPTLPTLTGKDVERMKAMGLDEREKWLKTLLTIKDAFPSSAWEEDEEKPKSKPPRKPTQYTL